MKQWTIVSLSEIISQSVERPMTNGWVDLTAYSRPFTKLVRVACGPFELVASSASLGDDSIGLETQNRCGERNRNRPYCLGNTIGRVKTDQIKNRPASRIATKPSALPDRLVADSRGKYL